jgi:hypothetical protein
MNFKERLICELEDLSIKIDKLKCFIDHSNVNDDIRLEVKQLEVMIKYKECLEERILKFMK